MSSFLLYDDNPKDLFMAFRFMNGRLTHVVFKKQDSRAAREFFISQTDLQDPFDTSTPTWILSSLRSPLLFFQKGLNFFRTPFPQRQFFHHIDPPNITTTLGAATLDRDDCLLLTLMVEHMTTPA